MGLPPLRSAGLNLSPLITDREGLFVVQICTLPCQRTQAAGAVMLERTIDLDKAPKYYIYI